MRVRACVRVCVHVCVHARACMHACMRVCVCVDTVKQIMYLSVVKHKDCFSLTTQLYVNDSSSVNLKTRGKYKSLNNKNEQPGVHVTLPSPMHLGWI